MKSSLKITLGASLIVLLFGAGCRRYPPPAEWNVLWIVIDDLAASHLGSAGYPRPITPELDRLAGSGVRFEWCVTQAPWSLPSYASMLSSKYPYELVLSESYLEHVRAETEVARSLDPARMPDLNLHWYTPVDPKSTFIAEVLQQQGLRTAALVNNTWLAPNLYGLERGFQDYHEGSAEHPPFIPADQTTESAAAWIKAHAGERWFLLVQLMDPHRPYQPHPEFNFGNRFIDLYDMEIAFTDRAIGSLLKDLAAAGLDRKTIVIVNADHGEGVFDKNEDFVGHGGGVLPEIVRVPLILSWPGGPKGRVISALCRNLDIMPTILDLLGIPAPPGLAGRSLVSEIKSRAQTSPAPAFTQAVLKGPEKVSILLQGDRPDQVFQAVALPAYHRISAFEFDGSSWQPRGADSVPPRLLTELQDFIARADRGLAATPRQGTPNLDEKTRQNLRGLGYLP